MGSQLTNNVFTLNKLFMSTLLALTERLISRVSLTPSDADCQKILMQSLAPLGFKDEWIYDGEGEALVTNLWAVKKSIDPSAKTLVFAGHTDVVPTGPVAKWDSDPFTPTYKNGFLYARGASDMKSSLAAMIVATQEFYASTPSPKINIAFLITSDEEGPATGGTVKVCEVLKARSEKLDWCIIGEPTAVEQTGDMIKNGRRGTLSGKLVVKGIQGHIAYPQLARNPVHQFAPAMAELVETQWDEGNQYFQPTSWQVSNIHAGTGASNVIPGECVVDFNFRFCTESSVESLQSRVHAILDRHSLEYDLKWTLGGIPFLTPEGSLVEAVRGAVKEVCKITPQLSTTGGTSDGRFISTICPEVIELGPPNATIHKVNECVAVNDLEALKNVYFQVLKRLNELNLSSDSALAQPV